MDTRATRSDSFHRFREKIMQIPFQGQVSQQEYRKALDIHYSRYKWLKWIFGFFIVMILFSSILMVIRDPSTAQTYLPPLVVPIIFMSFPWWFVRIQASAYGQKGNLYRSGIQGVADDNGISIAGPDIKVEVPWKAYTHSKQNEEMILLYQGKNSFHIFTSGLFRDTDDWMHFLDEAKIRITGKS